MSATKQIRDDNNNTKGAPARVDDYNNDQHLQTDDDGVEEQQHQQQTEQKMKEEAVEDLIYLRDENITEEQARAIFNRYDSNNKSQWNIHDLRLFLFDLRESFHEARVIPDEVLIDVLKELQLKLDGQDQPCVTWMDFKSYLMYLQQKPFHTINNTVDAIVPAEALLHAVHVTSLPRDVTRDHLLAIFTACGPVTRCFVNQDIAPEALVCFYQADGATAALQLNGTQILSVPIKVKPYDRKLDFPHLLFKRKPSALANNLAKVVITAQQVDERLHISDAVNKGAIVVNQFVEDHKIKEKVKDLSERTSEKIKQVDDRLKISETVHNVDQRYQISETAQRAASVVLSNTHVQKATSALLDLTSRLGQRLTELKEDTNAVVAEQQAKKQQQRANEEFELNEQQKK